MILRSRITVHLLVTLLGLCASAGNIATGQERTVAPPERLAAPPTDAPVDDEIQPARIPRPIDDELQNTRPNVSAGDRDGVRLPPMAATLYILEADWSKSPTAKQVEAELLAAFEGLKLTDTQRADIVKLAPSILFAPGNVPLYTPSHASGLLLWLKQHGLLKSQLQSIVRSERIMEDSSRDLEALAAASDRSPQSPASDRISQRLEFLDKDQLLLSVGESDISEGPFITKKNVQQWLVGWESTPGENAISLVSSTIVFEQRRGEKDPRNLGSNHQKEAYFLTPDDHVAIVGTQEIFYRTLEHQMNNAPVAAMVGSPKVAVNRVLGILVLGKPAVDLSVNLGPTGFFVPDRIGTVKHQRPRTQPAPQPIAGGYVDQSGRTYGMDLKPQPARRPNRSNSDSMTAMPRTTGAPATPRSAEATEWEQTEMARFAGTWRVTQVVSPPEGTPSPEDQFELRIVLDRFSHRFGGKEIGHGVISLENRPTGRPV
ncbi:MAG: hypothetical protein NT069_00650, partial [Planctomycetota bacterium]|nr:hypothetical protein [Planctomycetota bacterium]